MITLDNQKFVLIPDIVLYDNSLSPFARLLFGSILFLARDTGYCWAQNRYFSEKFDMRPETVSRAITALEKSGYIRLEFEGRGKEIRRIYTIDNFVTGYDEKINDPCEKSQGTLDEKVKQINTSDKYKKNNISLFNEFWNVYPKKRAKANAQKAFEKLNPDRHLLDEILGALSWQKQSPDWTKDGGQFIPYAASYLNGRRWEDEPTDQQNSTLKIDFLE